MRQREKPPTLESVRRLVLTALVALAATVAVACNNDQPDCERCVFSFYWTSEGDLDETDEACQAIDCEDALCGLCFDIVYNNSDKPVSGTCDSCVVEPDCGMIGGDAREYCATAPTECAARGIDLADCGCYDPGDLGNPCR